MLFAKLKVLAMVVALAGGCTRSALEVPSRSDAGAAPRVILWSVTADCPDGLAVAPEVVIVAGCEVITAYDRDTGAERWSAEMSDTSGWTLMTVTPDGVVVVAPDFEPIQAFDLATGAERLAPSNVEGRLGPRIPPGYTYEAGVLRFNGAVVWSGGSRQEPWVARLATLTVINDIEQGLRVVDDFGETLAAPRLDDAAFDNAPVLVAQNAASTVTADGVLYAIAVRD